MAFTREGFLLLAGLAALIIVSSALALSTPYETVLTLTVRLLALYGYLTLSISTLMTSLPKQIVMMFGKPFIKIHHVFAILGIAFTTAHPVAYAVQTLDASVFLPSFESGCSFWSLAGRPALAIFYVALVASLLRKRFQRNWRRIHSLMYVVLFFGIVHANLQGTDFKNPAIIAIFNMLFAASIFTFLQKRWKPYWVKKHHSN